MADKIRANYPAMQDMAKQLDQVKNRLSELTDAVLKIVEQVEGGVLQGDPGEIYSTALILLSLKISVLAAVAEEQSKGILAAISDMQQADTSAAGDFK